MQTPPVTPRGPAVFLSYASEDAEAAKVLRESLQACGVEVWFDQTELRGGDAWDAKIRQQIKACALFLPLISANTQARSEGYFRLEWKLAVDRSHLMADGVPFLLPVVLGDVKDGDARVPDRFRDVQWTRIGDEPGRRRFAIRVAQLLVPDEAGGGRSVADAAALAPPALVMAWHRWALLGAALLLLIGAAVAWHFHAKPKATPSRVEAALEAKRKGLSIMVLPLANLTGDKERAYLADALTSGVTAQLGRIPQTFVLPTATAMAYRHATKPIQELGQELGVRYVLHGGVQASGSTLRVSVQLADTQSGAQLWSADFDGDMANLFGLQDQIVQRLSYSVGRQITLATAEAVQMRRGDPQAVDLVLRARGLGLQPRTLERLREMEALYRQALRIEPQNLDALGGLAWALTLLPVNFPHDIGSQAASELWAESRTHWQQVNLRDPENEFARMAELVYYRQLDDHDATERVHSQLLQFAPLSPMLLNLGALNALYGGKPEVAKTRLEQALSFDPRHPPSFLFSNLCEAEFFLGRYAQAVPHCRRALALNPAGSQPRASLAAALAAAGDLAGARTEAAELLRQTPRFRIATQRPSPKAHGALWEQRFVPMAKLAGLPA